MKQIYVESYYRNGYSYNIINHPKQERLERKLEIIKFFDEFGAEATRKDFHESHSSMYLWKHKLKVGGGKLSALAPGDTTPVHPLTESFIIDYRTSPPGVDKTTIAFALTTACTSAGVKPVSESTVGRIPKSNKITTHGRTSGLLVRERKPA